MEDDITEKPPRASPPTSSHGGSADDAGSKEQQKSKESGVETPSEDPAALKKLDSQVINVKEEDDPFKHLPPAEAEILKRQVDVPVVVTNYRTLFRYATRNDVIIICISLLSAIAGGAALPLMTVSLGIGFATIMLMFHRLSSVNSLASSRDYSTILLIPAISMAYLPTMSYTLYTLPLPSLSPYTSQPLVSSILVNILAVRSENNTLQHV
jgi:hypothetical protein